jgi:hypothetical protein
VNDKRLVPNRLRGCVTVVVLVLAYGVSLWPAQRAGFRFEDGLAIDTAARGAKAWQAREVEIVAADLKEIQADRLGARVLARVWADGWTVLRRYIRHTPETPGTYANVDWNRLPWAIDVNDALFGCVGVRDTFSGTPGYSATAQILLHEIFHTFDGPTHVLSSPPAFWREAGFIQTANGRLRFNLTPKERDILKPFAEGEPLDCDDSTRWARAYAVQTLGRAPSTTALISPKEAFAEIGSHLVLDPNAKRYVSPALRAYFERVVFRALPNP